VLGLVRVLEWALVLGAEVALELVVELGLEQEQHSLILLPLATRQVI